MTSAIAAAPCRAKSGTVIPGLVQLLPCLHGDRRGCLIETYNERELAAALGCAVHFVQGVLSASQCDVLRGLHYQKRHSQGKLVRLIEGAAIDVAVDLRRASPTFGQYGTVILNAEKHNEVFIPKGFAHGFRVISGEAVFSYDCTDFYDKDDEGGIIWNDKTLGIDWGGNSGAGAQQDTAGVRPPILSDKDAQCPPFDILGKYFDMSGNWIGA